MHPAVRRSGQHLWWRSVLIPKYTIHFSNETNRDLARLTNALGVNSKADVVRRALNLLRIVVDEQKGGGRVVVENDRDKTKKELIPI